MTAKNSSKPGSLKIEEIDDTDQSNWTHHSAMALAEDEDDNRFIALLDSAFDLYAVAVDS